ncbi:MAG TPA: AMP-binding protein, partial [Candidatus Anoxymicrobiaceae bacterium]
MPKALTVANLADRSARKFGDKVFVTREVTFRYPILDRSLGIDSSKKEITYNEILKLTNGVAHAMRDRLGIRRGDRIAVLLTNLPEMGLVFTAAARLGAVIVPLNFMLKAREVTRIVSDCGAKVLITEPELFAMNIRDKEYVPGIEHWVMVADEERVPDGFESVDRLGEGISEDVWVEPADLAPDEVAAIFYTSGTTGFPKGAMLTSGNLMSTITTSLRLLRIGKKDF